MLHHPFTDLTDLLQIDGQLFESFVDAFIAYKRVHHYSEDYYCDPQDKDPVDDNSSDSEPESQDNEQGPLADFEVFSR